MDNIKHYAFCEWISKTSIGCISSYQVLHLKLGVAFFFVFGFRKPEVGVFPARYNLKRGFLFAEC